MQPAYEIVRAERYCDKTHYVFDRRYAFGENMYVKRDHPVLCEERVLGKNDSAHF